MFFFNWDWEPHPSTSGPGLLVWSAATASTVAGLGAAGSLELVLPGSDPASLENFT